MARAVTTIETKLMINTTEVGKTEGRNLLVVFGVAGDEGEFSGWFSGFRRSPDDVWGFDCSMWQVVDRSELGDVENEPAVNELA